MCLSVGNDLWSQQRAIKPSLTQQGFASPPLYYGVTEKPLSKGLSGRPHTPD